MSTEARPYLRNWTHSAIDILSHSPFTWVSFSLFLVILAALPSPLWFLHALSPLVLLGGLTLASRTTGDFRREQLHHAIGQAVFIGAILAVMGGLLYQFGKDSVILGAVLFGNHHFTYSANPSITSPAWLPWFSSRLYSLVSDVYGWFTPAFFAIPLALQRGSNFFDAETETLIALWGRKHIRNSLLIVWGFLILGPSLLPQLAVFWMALIAAIFGPAITWAAYLDIFEDRTPPKKTRLSHASPLYTNSNSF